MTHLQQLLADVLAAQAEAAAEDYGADAWSAVTAGAITAGEYWQALNSDLEEEKEAYWQALNADIEEEREREDPNGCWLDRLRELVGLPPRRR